MKITHETDVLLVSPVFQYTPTHNVVEVPKADYDSCQMSNVIQSYSDGNTAIPLDTPGKRYFICGTPGHCSQGMKLEIDTLATASPPQASPVNPPVASPVPEVPSPLPAQSPESAPAMSPVYPAESPMTDISPSSDVPSGLPHPDVPSGSPLPDVPSGSPFPDVPLAESPGSFSPGDSLPQTPDTAAAKAGFETNLKIGFVLGTVMLLAL